MEVREIIDSLQPQVLAMTGDFVDSLAEEAIPVARIFSEARAEYGVFACMGNHDLFDDYPSVRAAMSESGIYMLDNDNETIQIGDSALTIAGVGDRGRYYNYSDIEAALEGADSRAFKVLLSHRRASSTARGRPASTCSCPVTPTADKSACRSVPCPSPRLPDGEIRARALYRRQVPPLRESRHRMVFAPSASASPRRSPSSPCAPLTERRGESARFCGIIPPWWTKTSSRRSLCSRT